MSNEIQMRHDEVIRVLLVSTHDWFTSALQAVLEPEGFVFAHVRSARHAMRHVEQSEPDIVILSERLPDLDAAGLVRTLRAGGLPGSVPLLVYSPNFWNEEEQAKAVAAGAWDVIREPLRPAIVVARLRRLLAIGRLIRATDGAGIGDEAGLPDLAGLASSMQRIEATAYRNAVPLSCVVIGPSRPAVGSELERQRAAAAALCADNLRLSDLYGWIGDVDVGVVAYNTTAAGLISLVRRLNEQLTPEDDYRMLNPLSAGVVEFHAGPGTRGEAGADGRAIGMHGMQPPKIASLSRLAAAQAALREARAGGGGIRIGRPA